MSPARTFMFAVLMAGRVAAAEETPDAAVTPAPAPPPEPARVSNKPKLEVGGRVFVRETLSSEGDQDWTARTSIASARLGLRASWQQLHGRVEVELRKSAKLRTATVELQAIPSLAVRAGLFKIPLSPLELTSSWTLPVADRGLISNILRDRLQVAGRRVGAAVAFVPGADEDAPWAFRARAAYHQGVDDLGDQLDGAAADGFGKVGTARLELGPFGVSGQIRAGRPQLLGPLHTAWAASADATIAHGGLRVWLEGTLGSSWLVAEMTRDEARFLEARGLVAWRLGGAKAGATYVEPYAQVGLVDPDQELADDLVLEGTAGVNVGAWKRWRVQVEVELWRFGKNLPSGFVEPASVPVDRAAVVTQVGAAF